MSMNGIDPEETAEALERDPGHQGAADLIRQMATRIAELEAQCEGASPESARLLDCGLCYEEQGEEVHPHPECPIGRAAVPAGQAPATDHRLSVQHADALWDAVAIPGPTEPTFTEQHQRVCKAVADILDEMTPAAVLPASVDQADVLRDFLWRLEQSAGDAAAEKFLDDNPELRRVADAPSAVVVRRATDETPGEPTDADVVEAHRLALSFALGLGTGAPWDAIHDRAADLREAKQPAVGAQQPKGEARS